MVDTSPHDPISHPTLRRLAVYHKSLVKLQEQGVEFVSATALAEDLGFIPILVRKDLAATGVVGKPKVGFSVRALLHVIEELLGWNNTTDAFLVGVGSLGRALLGYRGFSELGLNIVAGFDHDPHVVGQQVSGKEVLPLEKLGNLARRMNIQIGIVTVPSSCAQHVANLLVESGIRAIWNFAPVKVDVPKDVFVQHENLASSLGIISSELRRRRLAQERVESVE